MRDEKFDFVEGDAFPFKLVQLFGIGMSRKEKSHVQSRGKGCEGCVHVLMSLSATIRKRMLGLGSFPRSYCVRLQA